MVMASDTEGPTSGPTRFCRSSVNTCLLGNSADICANVVRVCVHMAGAEVSVRTLQPRAGKA